MEEPGDDICAEFPAYGLPALLIEFCCLEFMEFWWSNPTMVLAGDDVDAGLLAELFALGTPLVAASCIAAA